MGWWRRGWWGRQNPCRVQVSGRLCWHPAAVPPQALLPVSRGTENVSSRASPLHFPATSPPHAAPLPLRTLRKARRSAVQHAPCRRWARQPRARRRGSRRPARPPAGGCPAQRGPEPCGAEGKGEGERVCWVQGGWPAGWVVGWLWAGTWRWTLSGQTSARPRALWLPQLQTLNTGPALPPWPTVRRPCPCPAAAVVELLNSLGELVAQRSPVALARAVLGVVVGAPSPVVPVEFALGLRGAAACGGLGLLPLGSSMPTSRVEKPRTPTALRDPRECRFGGLLAIIAAPPSPDRRGRRLAIKHRGRAPDATGSAGSGPQLRAPHPGVTPSVPSASPWGLQRWPCCGGVGLLTASDTARCLVVVIELVFSVAIGMPESRAEVPTCSCCV